MPIIYEKESLYFEFPDNDLFQSAGVLFVEETKYYSFDLIWFLVLEHSSYKCPEL